MRYFQTGWNRIMYEPRALTVSKNLIDGLTLSVFQRRYILRFHRIAVIIGFAQSIRDSLAFSVPDNRWVPRCNNSRFPTVFEALPPVLNRPPWLFTESKWLALRGSLRQTSKSAISLTVLHPCCPCSSHLPFGTVTVSRLRTTVRKTAIEGSSIAVSMSINLCGITSLRCVLW